MRVHLSEIHKLEKIFFRFFVRYAVPRGRGWQKQKFLEKRMILNWEFRRGGKEGGGGGGLQTKNTFCRGGMVYQNFLEPHNVGSKEFFKYLFVHKGKRPLT